MIQINPSHRFAADAVKHDLPRGSEAYRLMTKAQLADGFPHSYPAEAVEEARVALVAVGDARELTVDALVHLRAMEVAL